MEIPMLNRLRLIRETVERYGILILSSIPSAVVDFGQLVKELGNWCLLWQLDITIERCGGLLGLQPAKIP
jgi:hypothetical protein